MARWQEQREKEEERQEKGTEERQWEKWKSKKRANVTEDAADNSSKSECQVSQL
jgi:hypothetical protein